MNRLSPIKEDSLFDFASTSGRNLGKEVNGGANFNKFKLDLTLAHFGWGVSQFKLGSMRRGASIPTTPLQAAKSGNNRA